MCACIYLCMHTYIHIFQCVSTEKAWEQKYLCNSEVPCAQIWISNCHPPLIGARAYWKSGPVPGLGQGKYKINLEHLLG